MNHSLRRGGMDSAATLRTLARRHRRRQLTATQSPYGFATNSISGQLPGTIRDRTVVRDTPKVSDHREK